MKIYTKTGDKGETSLFGGERVKKHAPRIEAYGGVDELNSVIGTVRALKPPHRIDVVLDAIQHQLFILGADLATPPETVNTSVVRIQARDASGLERIIDELEEGLPKLTTFILPGGNPVGAQLQVARAVCRRAERSVVKLAESEDVGPVAVVFLNRLSDLLFVLARVANKLAGAVETPWTPSP